MIRNYMKESNKKNGLWKMNKNVKIDNISIVLIIFFTNDLKNCVILKAIFKMFTSLKYTLIYLSILQPVSRLSQHFIQKCNSQNN